MTRAINRVLLASGLLLAATTAVQTQAVAQNASPADSQSPAGLEEIVVSARKREETVQNVPAAVFAVTTQDLKNFGVADLVSAGDLVPGLQIARSTNNAAANIFLRGVGSSFVSISYDQAVSTVIDNVPISKGRVIFQSFTDMQQQEVLKGPQALFFGKNSTAGVVSVKTADPGDQPEYMVRGGYEYDGRTYTAEALASTPINDQLRVRLALRGSDMLGGYFTNVGPELNGVPRDTDSPREREYSGRLTVVYEPTDRFSINYKFSADSLNNDGVNGYTQLVNCQGPGGTPQAVFGVPNVADGCKLDRRTSEVALDPTIGSHFPYSRSGQPYLWNDSVLTSATAEYRWDSGTLTSVSGYYTFQTRDFGNFDYGSASQVFGGEHVKWNSLTEELRYASKFGGPLNFNAGVFVDGTGLQYARPVRLFSFLPPDPATGRTDDYRSSGYTNGNTYSAFAELVWAISDRLELSGGARYSREQQYSQLGADYVNGNAADFGLVFVNAPIADRFKDDNVSPAATLRWRPSDRLTLFASYKTGFKSGGSNLSETPFAGDTAASIHFGSETAKGEELGLKAELLDRTLWVGATLYRYRYSNLQVSLFDPVSITLHVANAGSYETKGIELDSVYAPPIVQGLKLQASAYYNRARYVDFVGACYGGQTIAEGCNQEFANGAYHAQDYAGRVGAHAPQFSGIFGGHYDVAQFGAKVAFGVSATARYTSSYFLQETLAPQQKQGGFLNLDAAIRLYDPKNQRWELAFIGRNLTNKLVGENAEDQPGTGTGAGTTVGTRADTVLITNAPIQIAVQATVRF